MIHRVSSPGVGDAYTLLQDTFNNCNDLDTLAIQSGVYYLSQALNWTHATKRIYVNAIGANFRPYGAATLNPLLTFGGTTGNQIVCRRWSGGVFLGGGITFQNLAY